MTDVTPVPLLAQPVVHVKQRTKLVEMRNQYELFDDAGTTIGGVEQVNQSGFTVLLRFLSDLDVVLPVELEISQTGATVLRLHKPWFRMTIDVRTADGRVLGTIRKKVRLGKARFVLLDPTGAELGHVRAENWRAKDFAVMDRNELEVARVTKKWAGLGRELFTDADHYVIHRPLPLDEAMQGLVLAAPFAVDLILKQKDSAGLV